MRAHRNLLDWEGQVCLLWTRDGRVCTPCRPSLSEHRLTACIAVYRAQLASASCTTALPACFQSCVRLCQCLLHSHRHLRVVLTFASPVRTVRFSSAARLLHLVPTELQSAHRASIAPTTPQAVRTSANAKAGGSASASLWDGWLNADDPDHNDCSESADDGDYADEEEEQEDDTLGLAAYF